jgi:hypothetical protein
MDATASPAAPQPSITINEWADFPLGRLVAWRTILILFWTQVLGSPGRPRTVVGGAIVLAAAVAVAVPWALFSRRFGNPVFHNPIARRLARRTDDEAPGLRIVYMLAALTAFGLTSATILFGAREAIGFVVRTYPGIPAFLGQHIR